MDHTYWHKQQPDEPLFPDLLWSRPEHRAQAGKLLIIGGNGYEFKTPANAYGDALEAGIGNAKVLLPDSMQKVVREIFPEAAFAPSTPSGSFARLALAETLELASWADGVLLAGDLGHNSETSVFLESLTTKYDGPLIITNDAADYCLNAPQGCLTRPDTVAVLNTAQMQKLAVAAKFPVAFTSDMDLIRLVAALHDFSEQYPLHIVLNYSGNLLVASGGQVSSTRQEHGPADWQTAAAASGATWYVQNQEKPFEALTTSVQTLA